MADHASASLASARASGEAFFHTSSGASSPCAVQYARTASALPTSATTGKGYTSPVRDQERLSTSKPHITIPFALRALQNELTGTLLPRNAVPGLWRRYGLEAGLTPVRYRDGDEPQCGRS